MRYSLDNDYAGTKQVLTTTFKTQLSVTAATGATTLRRAYIEEVECGADGTPNATDCQIVGKIDRQTTVGTGTSAVPGPKDTQDAAALITANVNSTAEPTVTAATILLPWSLNQRAGFLWQCAPDRGLWSPAVNTTGLGLRAKSTNYASTYYAGISYLE